MCDKFNKLLRDGNQRLVIFSKKKRKMAQILLCFWRGRTHKCNSRWWRQENTLMSMRIWQ